uniref:hypothetical protein n=1 Tax=Psychrobacter sp. TaxID=56811 RepID=UPI00159A8DBA|nr:hypothetical protein [Psychrobacter sp.]QJS05474.1 hypothetical protein [Psychrobacter sp.]
MKTKVGYKLGILENDKIICDKYWLRVKNDYENPFIYRCKEIGDEFGLSCSEVTRTVEDNAYLAVIDYQCKSCGTAKICYNRAELTSLHSKKWECENCYLKKFHRRLQNSRQERIESALEQRLIEENSYINQLVQFRESQIESVPNLDEIDVVDHYLLVAVISKLATENFRSTTALYDNLGTTLSPFHDLDVKIINRLMRKNLLLVNIENSYILLHAHEECLLQFDLSKMTFDFAYDSGQLKKLIIDSKQSSSKDKLVNSPEYKILCEDIQLNDCINYLTHCSAVNELEIVIGEKIESLLSTCLLRYSVSEIYFIIWKAVKTVSSYSLEFDIDKIIISNLIYDNIQKFHDEIRYKSSENKKHDRDRAHPKSVLNRIFFDEVHGIEDCGFRHTVDDLLKQL